ncbi:MAG: class I SAM-dependent methyltransferase [Candidatus Lokiarchaeota archaeon]|nr:class I SAM-dependent methyltransferase [Candidatus Lokiarchaeota archaeon]
MKNSYDFFAVDYHRKRKYHWRDLEEFLDDLKRRNFRFHGFNLDLGCANGRNFNLFLHSDSRLIGIDKSKALLNLARERLKNQNQGLKVNTKFIDLILSDINALPLRPFSITNAFSIATFHHLNNEIDRRNVLSQLYSILKKNGFLLLTVWRRYQKKYRYYFIADKIKRLFIPRYSRTQERLGLSNYGDKYIPWTLSSRKATYNRFYHFFSQKEIKTLLKTYKLMIISKKGGPNKKDNFFILTQKVNKNRQ